MTLSIMTLGIMTLSIRTISIITLSINVYNVLVSAAIWPIMPSVVVQGVVMAYVLAPPISPSQFVVC
jgi:hypothetical protein